MTEPTSNKVPKIRFKGFEEEWEEMPMRRLLTFKNGYNASKRQYGRGEKFINVLDIIRNDFITYDNIIGRVSISPKEFAKNEVVFGDILFQRSSETLEEVGQANVYLDKGRPATFGGFVIRGKPLIEFDPEFFNGMLKTAKPRREITSRSGGSTRYNIGQESLEAAQVTIAPAITEQTQIGGYFRELDRLIRLQQRKHDKLVTLKKAMLQKMFPQPGATTPEIRFKGFSGAWVEKKLGDSTTNVANNTLSRANLNYRSGLARNVHYGDILVRFGEVLDAQSDGVPFVSDDAVARKLKSSNLENGDVVMADAAEDETVGKCTEVQNVGDQIVVAGLHTIALRPLTRFAPFYLGYYLNSDAFHVQLLPIMQGTKVLSISKTAIKQTALYFPTDEAEQQKIGHYFRTLDELITQHALHLQKLKQIKSACLEKMFV